VAVAGGNFRVENNVVTGNATLFDGNRLETGQATSEVELFNGVRLRLATGSRGTVFNDRLVLEKGAGELQAGAGFRIEAAGLQLVAAGPGAAARVAVLGDRKLEASVTAGSFRVTKPSGTLIALMGAGRSLRFELLAQEAESQVPFEMTGCLEIREGRYVLRDVIAGVLEEVRGEQLDREVGNVIEVTASVIPGVKPVAGAMEVIQITRMRRLSRGCPAPPAGAVPTPAPPEAAPPAVPETNPPSAPPAPPVTVKGPGMSGATKAVIAGVAVGGGAAAAVVLIQKDKNAVSR
jgi:hypothetical protein